jgi:hypothetical protein
MTTCTGSFLMGLGSHFIFDALGYVGVFFLGTRVHVCGKGWMARLLTKRHQQHTVVGQASHQ